MLCASFQHRSEREEGRKIADYVFWFFVHKPGRYHFVYPRCSFVTFEPSRQVSTIDNVSDRGDLIGCEDQFVEKDW